jgi:hypothetical protein
VVAGSPNKGGLSSTLYRFTTLSFFSNLLDPANTSSMLGIGDT